ncbi:hypothetical protein MTP99_004901 [Tenebrio molitor]|nr:hypothetical protein MTP99_004901 [Tenebrio molitor]
MNVVGKIKYWSSEVERNGGIYQGQVVGISRSSGGGNSKVKWWGYRGQVVGENIKVKWWGYQGQVVGISRSTGGGNYQGQVVGISRSSSGDIKAKWWGYQGQGEGLRGQGKKKVVGGACPLQLPLLRVSRKVSFSECRCRPGRATAPQLVHRGDDRGPDNEQLCRCASRIVAQTPSRRSSTRPVPASRDSEGPAEKSDPCSS